MKLVQGVRVLALSCAGLLVALALWRQGEPGVPVDARLDLRDPSISPHERADRFAGVLADPLPEMKRVEAIDATPSRTVNLRLVPNENGVRVCGSVKLPRSASRTSARVALFSKNSSEPDTIPLHEAACDASGEFCVSTDRAGEFALAIFAPGFRPFTRLLELSMGAVEDLGEIELDAGAAIEGTVHADGKPQSDVELVAILSSSGTAMRTSDASLRWTRGRFEWSFTTARNDVEGRYRIAGLRSGDYRVRITAMRGPQAVFGYKTLEAMDVEAPSQAIDFKLVTSTLDLLVECDKQPLDAVSAELEGNGFHLSRLSDECGSVEMRCLPNLQCNLVVRRKGYRPRLIPIETPPAGRTRQTTVELEPIVELASLVVDLDTSDGELVPSARFALFAIDAQGRETLSRRAELWRAATNASSSRFVIDDIPAGKYRVEIGAGKPIARSSASQLPTYCFSELFVSIPSTGEVTERILLEPRGCIEVRAHDKAGAPVSARFRILANDGSGVQSSRHVLEWNQGMAGESNLDNDGSARVYVEPCSGMFVVELSFEGFVTQSVACQLLPGNVSSLDVTLQRDVSADASARR